MSDSGFNLSFVNHDQKKEDEAGHSADNGQKPAQKGLFASKPKQPAEDPFKHINDLSNQLHNFSRRLRVLEEGYINLRKKSQLTEQNMVMNNKNSNNEVKLINTELSDMKTHIQDIKKEILLIIKELKLCAKTDEVKTLEKYINLWEPMNFVTHKELMKILEEFKQTL